MTLYKKARLCAVTSNIVIRANANAVFEYVSDLRNDRHWRTEITDTKIKDEKIKLKTIAIEDSYLSKKIPNHKTILECVEFLPPKKIVYQSIPASDFLIMNSREFEEIDNAATKLLYTVAFDSAIVRYGIGFNLPLFFLKYYTKKTMNKYLKSLKKILEQTQV